MVIIMTKIIDSSTNERNNPFSVGQQVVLKAEPSRQGVIIEVLPAVRGSIRYRVYHSPIEIREYDAEQIMMWQFHQPISRLEEVLYAGPRLKPDEFIARLTARRLNLPQADALYALRAGRLHFIPFQFKPLLRFLRAERFRMLIADEVGVGKTIEAGLILRELPFNHDEISAEEAFQKIAGRLKNLGPRTLLFLRNLKEISWKIEDKCEGFYLRETSSSLDIEGVRRVTILWEAGSENGEEVWLVFERLLPDYRENVPNEGTLKVEAAFRLAHEKEAKREKIVPTNGAGLAVFFPTEKETCLRFLIQGPYRTTPARDNVPYDDEQNKRLIRETALLVAEALARIKKMGLLTADFLDVLPQEADFPEEKGKMFRPVLAEVQ